MSIINQVLRDLDQQRGPNDGLEVAALRGVGLVRSERSVNWPALATATAVIVFLALGYQKILSDEFTDTEYAAPPLLAEVDETQSPNLPVVDVVETATPSAEVEQLMAPAVIPASSRKPVELPILSEQPAQRITEAPIDDSAGVKEGLRPEPVVKTLSSRQQADLIFASAQRALEKHDKTGAQQQFQEALSLNPQHLAARLQLTGIYLQRDQQVRAAALLEDGLALNSAEAKLAHPYARLLASQGQLIEALQLLASFTDAESLALSAAIHARLNQHVEAAALYTRAIKQDVSQGNWWLGLALSLEQQGLASRAQQAYRRAGDLPLAENVQAFVNNRIDSIDNRAGGS